MTDDTKAALLTRVVEKVGELAQECAKAGLFEVEDRLNAAANLAERELIEREPTKRA